MKFLRVLLILGKNENLRFRMSVITWIFLGLIGFYTAMLLYLWAFQRGLIYRPDPLRPISSPYAHHGLSEVKIKTKDSLDLLAWWFPPKESQAPVILYLHGNAGNLGFRADKIAPYLERGFGVLLLAWRGYSGNPGRPSESGLYEDGEAGLRWLQSKGIYQNRTILYGESLGSGVAVELASKGFGSALILEAPFSSLPDAAQAHYPFFPAYWLVEERYNSEGKIPLVRIPVLVGHGKKDTVIPYRLASKLFNAANEPKEFLTYSDAGHNNLYDYGWGQGVIRFLEKNLSAN